MLSDLRLAARSFRKSPGFAAIATLTLALGLGANTTFFSVLYGVVLKPLPFRDAHELVELKNVGDVLGRNVGRLSIAELRDYRARHRSFVGIGSHAIGRVTLGSENGAERVIRARVTSNLFPLLGVTPALGRNFEETEEAAGRDRVVIVSHAFWQTHFGGSADVLDRTVRLNGIVHAVVGVMPANFVFEDPATALWQPLDFSPHGEADRREHFLPAVARLSPGVSVGEAAADMQRVARQLRAELPDVYPPESDWSLDVVPLRQSQFGHLRTPLAALMAAAGVVLLIASVNVAIMFLLRAAVRRRELMIRLSLGARRRHIVRQLLAESLLICAVGALGGLLLASAALRLLKLFPPADIPRLAEVELNGPAAAFMLGVLVLVTLIVGLAPAVALLTTKVAEGLTASTRATEGRRAVRARDALLIVEIALAVVLLVAAGLSTRTLQNLVRDDIGFQPAQLFSFKTNLTPEAYPDLAQANGFYDRLTEKLEQLPGVTAVAAVSYLPLSGESQFMATVPVGSRHTRDDVETASAAWRVVRGPYFGVMGASLVTGRDFEPGDHATSLPVAVVNDVFARQFWREAKDAIGQQIRCGTGDNAVTRTIVGIVRRLKHGGPGQIALPEVYVPQAQQYQRGMYLIVKTSAPATLPRLIRAELAAVDPTVPMYFAQTMEQRVANAVAMPRFIASLTGAFSVLALVLAAVGIFGVTGYATAQRSREFGIRFAIGASRSHVAGLVLGRVGRLALIGGAAGGYGAYELAQLLKNQLYGVDPADPVTLVTSALALALTALIASLVPLAHALRTNPAEALRAE